MTIDEQKELEVLRKEHHKLIAQRQKYTQRRLVRVSLLEQKAVKAGLFVTDKEVDDEVARRSKVKK